MPSDRARRRLPGDLWLILGLGAAAILAIVVLTLAGAW